MDDTAGHCFAADQPKHTCVAGCQYIAGPDLSERWHITCGVLQCLVQTTQMWDMTEQLECSYHAATTNNSNEL